MASTIFVGIPYSIINYYKISINFPRCIEPKALQRSTKVNIAGSRLSFIPSMSQRKVKICDNVDLLVRNSFWDAQHWMFCCRCQAMVDLRPQFSRLLLVCCRGHLICYFSTLILLTSSFMVMLSVLWHWVVDLTGLRSVFSFTDTLFRTFSFYSTPVCALSSCELVYRFPC